MRWKLWRTGPLQGDEDLGKASRDWWQLITNQIGLKDQADQPLSAAFGAKAVASGGRKSMPGM